MVMCVLQPFTTSALTIDKLLGRDASSPMEENAAVEEMLGIPATPEADEANYQMVMQKIAARRMEEAHGGTR